MTVILSHFCLNTLPRIEKTFVDRAGREVLPLVINHVAMKTQTCRDRAQIERIEVEAVQVHTHCNACPIPDQHHVLVNGVDAGERSPQLIPAGMGL